MIWKRLQAACMFCLVLLLGGCGEGQDLKSRGIVVDITEDFHHRMLAGVLELRKEPVVFSVMKIVSSTADLENVPNAYMKLSWEMGSFWVQSNDNKLVVSHWNTDVIYGHVAVSAASPGDGIQRFFPQSPQHPVEIFNRRLD